MSGIEAKKLKICHVITRMIVGGAQENTFLSVVGQREAGHDVILATGPSEGREGDLLDAWRETAIPVVKIPTLCREVSPWRDLVSFWRLFCYFRREKFDVVHTHSAKAGIIGRFAAFCAKIPVVVHTNHGQPWSPRDSVRRKKFYVALEKAAAKVSHRIYAVAQAMVDECVALGIAPREKFRVVYSGMAIKKFLNARRDAALRATLGIPEKARVIVTLARLSPLKGYEFIPDAFIETAKKFPDLHLLILGDGAMREEVAAKIAAASLTTRVHFAGLIAPQEVPEYLAQGDLLWHLSLREGLPRSAVQALGVGIPVVGFALDGTPEVVLNGETGFCVAPEAVTEVVAATVKLFEDPALMREMGQNGQKLVAARFDWRQMAQILADDYEKLRLHKTP